jgi:A/G-specific adenine glycosylase
MKQTVNMSQSIKDYPLQETRNGILSWWDSVEHRHFPWRETKDPLKILAAEILLHRTRADQVVTLYQLFLKKYPDINSIAQSSPGELVESFRSAGLQWRWELLHSMAVDINTRFNGQIPQRFDDLISLPGVSHYIASAVRCFSFGYPDVLLDTNTVRIVGRVFGLPITDSSRRSTLFRGILEELMEKERCRDFNFALLDFAAKVCRPKPIHEQCPIKKHCKFYKLNELKFEGILKNG